MLNGILEIIPFWGFSSKVNTILFPNMDLPADGQFHLNCMNTSCLTTIACMSDFLQTIFIRNNILSYSAGIVITHLGTSLI